VIKMKKEVEPITEEEAVRLYNLFHKNKGYFEPIINKFINSKDVAIKVEISRINTSEFKKRFPKLDFFTRKIENKYFLIIIKKDKIKLS